MPDGYACVRVDSRGAGRSPGYLDVWSPREAQDLYHCVEWAGTQAWCNGKVGINGISYYAMNQWQVGALKPPHLAALCIWEGSSDYYRELCRHGGILCDFSQELVSAPGDERAARRRRARRQERGDRRAGRRARDAAEGRARQEPRRLRRRRASAAGCIDDYYAARTAEFEDIEAPLLSAGNWGGMGLHPRGNFEGFLRAGSKQKWLEVHGDTHFTHFYSQLRRGPAEALLRPFPQGRGHRLGQAAAGVAQHPPSRREIRAARRERMAARAHAMDEIFICIRTASLGTDGADGRDDADLRDHRRRPDLPHAAADREPRDHRPGRGQAVGVVGHHRRRPVPGAAACSIPPARRSRSSARTIRACRSGSAGCAPRIASSIPTQSLPYRPWHTHDEEWPLKPGEPVELDIEIWPTSIVVPPGYRLALTVRGKDYEVDGTRRGAAECALSDEGRRPVPAHQSGRPPAGDLRRPQHAALRARQAALPLVAGHSGRRKLAVKTINLGGDYHEAHCMPLSLSALVGLLLSPAPLARSTIRAAPSPSSCPTRPAARPTSSRA